MRGVITFLAGGVLLWVLPAVSLHSQGVRGQVVDSLTGAAIGNGFVVVLDNYGVEVGRTLTPSSGRFIFNGLKPGRYRLRSERIGYRARETALFAVWNGETAEYTLRVTSIPVQLAGIDVRGERRCGSLEEAPEFGALWEEARKALSAASWSADHQKYFYRSHVYRRVLDSRRRKVLRETAEVESGAKRVPYASWHPDSLVAEGYVLQRSGLITYHGPDANVLLHRSFHVSHCFRAVRGEEEHAGMLGLAFEPIPHRKVADIEGVLWVDQESSELRSIEYGYTGLKYNNRNATGGTIEFARMPSGAWIIVRWEIRAPVSPDLESLTGHQRKKPVAGFRDVGEAVIEVTDMLGKPIYRASNLSVVRGIVFDSTRDNVMSQALIRLVGSGYDAVTRADGTFELVTLLQGKHRVTIGRMDSLGYTDGQVEIDLRPSDTVHVALTIPTASTVRRSLCGNDDGAPILLGTLLEPVSGEPLYRGQLIASWIAASLPSEEPRQVRKTVRSDRQGRFAMCELPVQADISLELRNRLLQIEPIVVRFSDRTVRVTSGGITRSYTAPERIWRIDMEAVARR